MTQSRPSGKSLEELFGKLNWHIESKAGLEKNSRTIDRMTLTEIKEMYDEQYLQCDMCTRKLERYPFTAGDHVQHVINPDIWWKCEFHITEEKEHGSLMPAKNV